MAWISIKKQINYIYLKIDKIAKKGKDNVQEYYDFIDDIINKGQYGLFTQVLLVKYDFDYTKYTSVDDIKKKSYMNVLYETKTPYQERRAALLNNNDIYQIGLHFYKKVSLTSVTSTIGSNADLRPYIVDGVINRIDVINGGRNYTEDSEIVITGGITASSAAIQLINGVRGGVILKVNVVDGGESHNIDIDLGYIEEVDVYTNTKPDYTNDEFQEITKNKITYLVVNPTIGLTYSSVLDTWDSSISYDNNLLNLYSSALTYMESFI